MMILSTLVIFLFQTDTTELLKGRWKLIEKKQYEEPEDMPSIMAVPEEEQTDKPRKEEIRDLIVELKDNRRLLVIMEDAQQNTSWFFFSSVLTLGNRSYKLISVSKRELIISEEDIFGEIYLIFKRKS